MSASASPQCWYLCQTLWHSMASLYCTVCRLWVINTEHNWMWYEVSNGSLHQGDEVIFSHYWTVSFSSLIDWTSWCSRLISDLSGPVPLGKYIVVLFSFAFLARSLHNIRPHSRSKNFEHVYHNVHTPAASRWWRLNKCVPPLLVPQFFHDGFFSGGESFQPSTTSSSIHFLCRVFFCLFGSISPAWNQSGIITYYIYNLVNYLLCPDNQEKYNIIVKCVKEPCLYTWSWVPPIACWVLTLHVLSKQ